MQGCFESFSILMYLFMTDFGPDGFPLGGATLPSRKNPGSKSMPNERPCRHTQQVKTIKHLFFSIGLSLLFLENSPRCGSYVRRRSCLPSELEAGRGQVRWMDRCKVKKATGTNKQPNECEEAGPKPRGVRMDRSVCSC